MYSHSQVDALSRYEKHLFPKIPFPQDTPAVIPFPPSRSPCLFSSLWERKRIPSPMALPSLMGVDRDPAPLFSLGGRRILFFFSGDHEIVVGLLFFCAEDCPALLESFFFRTRPLSLELKGFFFSPPAGIPGNPIYAPPSMKRPFFYAPLGSFSPVNIPYRFHRFPCVSPPALLPFSLFFPNGSYPLFFFVPRKFVLRYGLLAPFSPFLQVGSSFSS